MAAAFDSIVSALRRQPATVHRFATVAWLLSTLLVVGAARADAQEIVEYYGTDALGSIRVVFAPDGTVKARSDYLPFGEEWAPVTPGGPLPTQRFTGQQRDAEESLDYFQARSYQTRTGRMTTTDPVFSALFAPQRWNRYAYAVNNPLAYVDPDGRDPIRLTETVNVMGRTLDNSGSALPWSLVAGDYTVNGIEAIPGWAFYSPSHGAIETWGTPEMEAWLASHRTETGNQDAGDEATADGDKAVVGGAIPACPNCIPYTGDPDEFVSTGDFWSTFINSGGLSLGSLFKTGSSFVAKGAYSRILSVSPKLAQKGWDKHKAAFDLAGNWHPGRAAQFTSSVNQFINNPVVSVIEGRFKGMDVIHFLHPRTGVNLMSDRAGNYISVWRLSAEQMEGVVKTGRLF